MGAGGFGPKILHEFTVPFLPEGLQTVMITETVVNTWIIMAVLILFAYAATRNLKKVPKGTQLVTEALVGGINGLTKQTMGDDKGGFAPYVGTLLLFVGLSNIAGLFNVRPPTADVNTTMGLALMTFVMIHGFGIKSKGVGTYLKGFLEPMPFLLPLNIMGELATPISLSFRLFGNIVGGVIVMNLLYGALYSLSSAVFGMVGMSAVVPVFQVIAAPLHVYFDLFAGLLQSFIFAMLTMVFVSIAMD